MANLLDTYGIKEVADVTMYEILDPVIDASDYATYNGFKPVLFLDTLKVSTIEQTASQTSARGGKGNPELIVWDFGKEITLNITDALFSPQSMNVMLGGMSGGKLAETTAVTSINRMTKVEIKEVGTVVPENEKWYSTVDFSKYEAGTSIAVGTFVYIEKSYAVTGRTIEITAANFPGTYKLVGETFARSQKTGKDEYFQFEVPKAKMGAENTITLEAEGDPTVFNMTMKVLRPDDGVMMKLTQFSIDEGNTYVVTLDPNGGSWSGNQTSVIKTGSNGKLVALPSAPTAPEGKQFAGWYDAKTSGTEVTTSTEFTANSTIYATWQDE